METEIVVCDYCKDEHNDTFVTHRFMSKDGFDLVKCDRCGLIYVNPRPTKEELIKLYNTEQISSVGYYASTETEDMMTFGDRLDFIRQYIKKKNPKLLDVGCNVGTLIRMAKQRCWNVQGIDINKKCINHKLNIEEGDLITCKFDRKFDIITMIELIEHVQSPLTLLNQAYSLLHKGGILYLSTPDIGSLMAKVFRTRWTPILPNEHMYYFTKKTLINLLKAAGFKIEIIKYAYRYRGMATILDRLQRYNKVLSKLLMKILPKGIILKIKLYDELEVVARKNV